MNYLTRWQNKTSNLLIVPFLRQLSSLGVPKQNPAMCLAAWIDTSPLSYCRKLTLRSVRRWRRRLCMQPQTPSPLWRSSATTSSVTTPRWRSVGQTPGSLSSLSARLTHTNILTCHPVLNTTRKLHPHADLKKTFNTFPRFFDHAAP